MIQLKMSRGNLWLVRSNMKDKHSTIDSWSKHIMSSMIWMLKIIKIWKSLRKGAPKWLPSLTALQLRCSQRWCNFQVKLLKLSNIHYIRLVLNLLIPCILYVLHGSYTEHSCTILSLYKSKLESNCRIFWKLYKRCSASQSIQSSR